MQIDLLLDQMSVRPHYLWIPQMHSMSLTPPPPSSPPISNILINSYRSPTEFFVDGDVILPQEGTTQGDPLAMPMYGLATIPLTQRLDVLCRQLRCADNSAATATVEQLYALWNRLAREDPAFGYFSNPSKTWLVTKQITLMKHPTCLLDQE